MFIGLKSRKIDSKRRFNIPVEWRIEEEYVFVCDTEIEVYPLDVWVRRFEALDKNSKLKLSSKSKKVKVDSNGRVLLPRSISFENMEVDLIGMLNYFILKEPIN